MKQANHLRLALLCAIAALAAGPAAAQVPKWEFGAAIYAYLPTISGKSTFPATGGGSSVSVDADTILENLKMTFMGSFEASNGKWGGYTDLVYMDVGHSF
jgi:hypothetical protein